MPRPITHQPITAAKKARVRELRAEMTVAEQILWDRLRPRELSVRFRRQQYIDGFVADFYCHAAKLAIEVDGGIHTHQQDYDVRRDLAIRDRGLEVLRVTNEETFRNIEEVMRKILARSAERIAAIKAARAARRPARKSTPGGPLPGTERGTPRRIEQGGGRAK